MTANLPSRPPRGWPAWLVMWAAILGSSLVGVVVLATLSLEGERAALESALTDHLGSVAGAADGALHGIPIETIVALNGEKSTAELAQRIDDLATHGGLRGLALIGPDDDILGHGGRWVPLAAERDLLAAARAGSVTPGPLYHDADGELYQTAYRPLTGHPGWVVAVEGSASTLGAVDTLRNTQMVAGIAVVAIASLVSSGLAFGLSRPIRMLGAELSAARPGSPPEALGDYGFREVRQVSAAARGLLAAIVARDAELTAAHRHELEQLTRMAAGLAHEVGNPLNAISLSVERLAILDDAARRAAVVARVRDQLGELEGIVNRLRDLTQPLRPQVEPVDLGRLVDGVGAPVPVRREGSVIVQTDPILVAQIVRNLLLNAGQAGAREVHVVIGADPPVIDVTDDGPGLDPSDVERIFDWFHTSRAAGSGLGLPVSRRIAEALGGTLELVTARPASFRLHLPGPTCSP